MNGVQEAASSNLVTRTRKYRKTYVLRYFSFVPLRNYTGMNRTKPVCFGLLHTLLHTISRGQIRAVWRYLRQISGRYGCNVWSFPSKCARSWPFCQRPARQFFS
nr:MAG TPA: hypothetical protein [Caudoviricetes sp.]